MRLPEQRLQAILADLRDGRITVDHALAHVRGAYFQDLEHSTIDHDRVNRTGFGEVIYGEHKTPQQVADVFAALAGRGHNVLATRVSDDARAAVQARVANVTCHPEARMVWLQQQEIMQAETSIAVVSAGTSDFAVAEEAALTAEFYGNPVTRVADVGVAGIHRLLAHLDPIRAARVIVVVAGMEGALPSVVGGLVARPVIAVPTSVGYGAAFEGVAALLGMLTSCASGVAVVNIDNGFGAGHLASMINRL